ncbi:hypothetical protein P154DRAFT_568493 [Amniculicola lignicola CBS 123094]|uniref:Uncharacterized protein n=1 Tax=Amniculicola lignicola CBS 123094 TaxID=1392246 RepID=A0A6A5X463_9PLEO|nr:hypothetical protein P154DRAFT_568493 [Amniculicola lignicola CBS 123094]
MRHLKASIASGFIVGQGGDNRAALRSLMSRRPQETEPKNCNSRDTQPTDIATQQPVLSDIAPREAVGFRTPQETNSVRFARCETETEIEIVDLTNGQELKAASLAHESAPQVSETADCIRLQKPKIAYRAVDGTADAGHCGIANANSLTIVDPHHPKLSTAEVESPKAEIAGLDALGAKTTSPTQGPSLTNINHDKTTELIPSKTADPLQDPQAVLSALQDSRCSNSKEAGHSRVLTRLTIDGNSQHSPTDASPTLGNPGKTNEDPIVLDDSSAGDSRCKPPYFHEFASSNIAWITQLGFPMIPSHNAVGSADTVLMVATVDASFDVGQNLTSVPSLRGRLVVKQVPILTSVGGVGRVVVIAYATVPALLHKVRLIAAKIRA